MDTRPRIALQLYSIRNQAERDLAAAIEAAARWGCDGVEFAGFFNHPAKQVRRWLDDHGLSCPSTHTNLQFLDEATFDQTVDYHREIGCDTIIVPYLPPERRDTLRACQETLDLFLELQDKLRAHGMRTGFHVHGNDVIPLAAPAGDGRSPWAFFAESTPEDFILQFDTANGMVGGVDPVDLIRQFPGRAPLLHLKEYGDGTHTLQARKGHGVSSIGDGDIDWPAVIDAALDVGGTEWFIVEQEGHATLPELQASQRSVESLQRFLRDVTTPAAG